jgi:hypothetical protein
MRADRSAAGTLPTRAFRYCEALTSASSFGWYLFPPMDFTLQWDGTEVIWTYPDADAWFPLQAAQFPDFAAYFDSLAPDEMRGFAPPFLHAFPEPGVVQIWTGYFARTRADWNLLIRAPANLARSQKYDQFEGIVETDRWFGPVFTNLRLSRSDVPICFSKEMPLVQLQPVHRSTCSDEMLGDWSYVEGISKFSSEEWDRFRTTVIRPNIDPDRPKGAYAVNARKRQAGSARCPFSKKDPVES